MGSGWMLCTLWPSSQSLRMSGQFFQSLSFGQRWQGNLVAIPSYVRSILSFRQWISVPFAFRRRNPFVCQVNSFRSAFYCYTVARNMSQSLRMSGQFFLFHGNAHCEIYMHVAIPSYVRSILSNIKRMTLIAETMEGRNPFVCQVNSFIFSALYALRPLAKSQSLRMSGQFFQMKTVYIYILAIKSQSLRMSGQFFLKKDKRKWHETTKSRNPFVCQVNSFYNDFPNRSRSIISRNPFVCQVNSFNPQKNP